MYHNLKVEMAKAHINQSELAKILGIKNSTLSLKLNGKSILTLQECTEIKKALGTVLPIEELFSEEDVAGVSQPKTTKSEAQHDGC